MGLVLLLSFVSERIKIVRTLEKGLISSFHCSFPRLASLYHDVSASRVINSLYTDVCTSKWNAMTYLVLGIAALENLVSESASCTPMGSKQSILASNALGSGEAYVLLFAVENGDSYKSIAFGSRLSTNQRFLPIHLLLKTLSHHNASIL
jgi:hypothetical protein